MRRLALFVALVFVAGQVVVGAVVIDSVPVGNLGNSNDTHGAGYGGVSYSYSIGKYEVTAGQYTEFLNGVAGVDNTGLYNTNMWSDSYGCKIERHAGSGTGGDPYQYRVAGDREDRPVNYVSFWDAARFANWLHNGQGSGDTEGGAYINVGNQSTFARQAGALLFLPTEDEWYKAAYYDGAADVYYDYSTGTNDTPSNDLVEPTDSGNNATFYISGGDYTIGSPYWQTEVGAHENSSSPYGTFDQGGNVSEWNETFIPGLYSGSYRGLRGGSFRGKEGYLPASFRDPNVYPSYESNSIGFRVASIATVPEPSSILVWSALAVTGLLYSHRRRKA